VLRKKFSLYQRKKPRQASKRRDHLYERIADALRDDGTRLSCGAEHKLMAFLELEQVTTRKLSSSPIGERNAHAGPPCAKAL
jgi:hypothetical protein